MTTKRDKSGRSNVTRVGSKSDRLNNVGGVTNAPADNQGNVVANSFVAKTFVNGGKR